MIAQAVSFCSALARHDDEKTTEIAEPPEQVATEAEAGKGHGDRVFRVPAFCCERGIAGEAAVRAAPY